jgi:hypothetical protein
MAISKKKPSEWLDEGKFFLSLNDHDTHEHIGSSIYITDDISLKIIGNEAL